MTGINFTASNVSLWIVGHSGTVGLTPYVGWQAVVHEYGWWLLVVMAVLLAAFIYTKHLVLALMVTITCGVNIWWIEYASIPDVPMLLARAVFVLLIAFVWLFWLQARRVSYVASNN